MIERWRKMKVNKEKVANITGVISILVATATVGKDVRLATMFYMVGSVSFGYMFHLMKNKLQVVLNVVLLIIQIINLTK